MTLLELCDPVFLYICRLNRSSRKGGHFEALQVRTDMKSLLEKIKATAAAAPGLEEKFEQVERPLVYFIDSIILCSRLPMASEWEPLQVEMWGERAGDDIFFDDLDATLKEKGEAANDRLAVFYTCLGLGFQGRWAGNPEHLRRLSGQISARIRHLMETDDTTLVCPAAYEHVNTTDLVTPPAKSLVKMAIVLAALIVGLFVGNLYLYNQRAKDLTRELDAIVKPKSSEPAAPAK